MAQITLRQTSGIFVQMSVLQWVCVLLAILTSHLAIMSSTATTPTTALPSNSTTNSTEDNLTVSENSTGTATPLSSSLSPSPNPTLKTPHDLKSGWLMNNETGLWSSDLEFIFTRWNWTERCNSTKHKWCQFAFLESHTLNQLSRWYYNFTVKNFHHKNFIQNYGLFCQPRTKNYGYVRRQRFSFDVVSGPERMLLKDLQCINLVYDGFTSGGHLLHILFGGRTVSVKGCHVTLLTKNCMLNSTDNGMIPVPGYGNFTAETYSLFLKDRDAASECEIKLACINKGKPKGGGAYGMKGYFVLGILRPGHQARRLMSASDLTPEESCGTHSHLKKITSHHIVSDFKDGPGKVISVCNGSSFFHGRMPESLGCYSVRSIETSHHCTYKQPNCIVEPKLKDCTSGKCIMVRMSVNGIVRMSRGSTVETVRCGKECLLPPLTGSGDILIDCPGGTQHFLQKNIVDLECPYTSYFPNLMLYICRMSHRPKTTIFFFLWVSLGYLLFSTVTGFLFLVLKGVCRLIEALQRKALKESVCKFCELHTKGATSIALHQANCENGLCPFCANRLPTVSLGKHARVCPKRKNVEEAIEQHDLYNATPWFFVFVFGVSEFAGSLMKKTAWLLTTIILFVVIISPVKGDTELSYEGWSEETIAPGLWDEEVALIEGCHQECFVTENDCECPEYDVGRRLLFFHMLKKNIRSGNKLKLMSSLSLDTPWGLLKVEKSFKPLQSVANLQLSWTSEEEIGGKIVLSGKATSILQLKERTGAVWELSSPKAIEKKKLVISVMDFSQEYKSQFQYLTGDRLVSEWPKATCTGPCPDRCSCHTSTCFWKTWPNSRKWTCNPTWCWGVGTGCTCCGIDVEKPYQNYLLSKWSLDYIKTDVAICVELSDMERHCDLVHAGSRFHLGPVTVIVSDPQNVQHKLPSEIATVHKVVGGELDLMHTDKVISASNLCKLQSCTHGAPGDIQIYKPNYLIKYSVSNKINSIEDGEIANDTWMSWQGSDLDYFCTTGSWPTCTFSGVVRQNTAAFKNLETVESNFLTDFFFHTTRVEVKGDRLALPLKARPHEGGGELTVLVEVDGLELHSKMIVPVGLSMKIASCKGCYSCTTGFTCDIAVGVEDPAELSVHLECDNPNVVISEGSLIASGVARTGKLKGFSTVKETELCLVLQESKLTSKLIKDCVNLKLDEPDDIILETRGTLISHQNDTCSSRTSCWLTSTGLFFSGLSTFFTDYFGSFFIGLLIFLLPVGLLLLFFCFGNRIFFCRKFRSCCKANAEDKEKFKNLVQSLRHGGFLQVQKDQKGSWRHMANTALGKVKERKLED
ncbi:glycoprotein precursor [Wufeng Crocidura attenuata orthonairovirus 1]|uniref:M polyprotein n=1 Tax=Wufeng Crocidura attenuata orthonairovirus 1 TaxID=2929009 RepID=A0A8T9KLU2_9VIRU|nr:glycoprotein precursor [Wufeng Crocidura attenuata orthonairovirus 1]